MREVAEGALPPRDILQPLHHCRRVVPGQSVGVVGVMSRRRIRNEGVYREGALRDPNEDRKPDDDDDHDDDDNSDAAGERYRLNARVLPRHRIAFSNTSRGRVAFARQLHGTELVIDHGGGGGGEGAGTVRLQGSGVSRREVGGGRRQRGGNGDGSDDDDEDGDGEAFRVRKISHTVSRDKGFVDPYDVT
jgi:hypothetical protein